MHLSVVCEAVSKMARWTTAASLAFVASAAAQPSDGAWTRVNITSKGLVNGLPMPRCIDGSPPAYYIKPGTGENATKFILFFEGGGWCTSLESCLSRSRTDLGSSLDYPQTTNDWNARDLLNTNCTANYNFCGWTSVYHRYCDGQSRAGSTWDAIEVDGKSLYFRGLPTLLAMLQQLLAPTAPSLSKASHLLISGSSAGGLTTYLHADTIAAAVRAVNPGIVVKSVPEVGFFIDGASVWGGEHIMTEAYIRAQTFANISAANAPSYNTNAECIAQTPESERWKCFMAQYVYPHIATPVFILNSKYDQWQLSNILAPDANFTDDVSPDAAWQPCISDPLSKCNTTQYGQFQNYSVQFMGALNASLAATPAARLASRGGFITSCDLHTTCIGGLCHKIHIDGTTMYNALSDWFFERNSCASGSCWWYDGDWPNNPTCAGPLVEQWRGFEL